MNSPAKSRTRRRRIFRALALASVLLVVLVAIFHRALLASGLRRGARAVDLQLEFAALEGNLWGQLELRNLRLNSLDGSATRVRVQAESIRAEYSLAKLLTGDLAGLQLLSCRALEGEVALPEADAGAEESEADASGSFELPNTLPQLDLDVTKLRLLLTSDSPLELSELQLKTDKERPEQLALTIAKLDYDSRSTPVRATLAYRESRLEILGLEAIGSTAVTGFVELRSGQTAWSLDATSGGGRLRSSGTLAPGTRQLELDCDAISLQEIASFGREPLESDPEGLLDLTLAAADDGAPSWPPFHGQFALLQARFGETTLDSLTSEVAFDGKRFTLEHLTSTGPEHEVLARAIVEFAGERVDVEIDELSMRNGPVDLALQRPASFTLQSGKPVALSDLELQGSAGHLQIRFDPNSPECVELLIEELGSAQLFAQFSDHIPEFDQLQGTARACWSAEGWTSVGLNLALGGLSFKASDEDFSGRVRFLWSEDTLKLEELHFDQGERRVLDAHGSIGLQSSGLMPDAPLELELELELERVRSHLPEAWLASLPATGDVTVRLTASGTSQAPLAKLLCEVNQFELLGKSDEERSFLANSKLSLQASLAERIELEELRWTAANGHELRVVGALDLAPSRLFREPGFLEALQNAPVSATAKVATDTLDQLSDWLRDWFDSTSILRSGHLDGQFTLAGTLAEPEPKGTLDLTGATLRVPGIPPVTQVSAGLRFTGTQLEVSSLKGELGAAPFTATATVDFAESPATIRAKLDGKDVLVVRNSDVKVRCDLDLEAEGPITGPLVRGEITLAQGRLVSPLEVLNFDFQDKQPARREGLQLFRFPEPPLRDMRFDVQLRSRGAFEIKNNVANGSVRPELHLSGTGEVPILDGVLYIDSTRVKLPANDLTVTAGSVRFDKSDPFFPRLEIRAGARIKGYDVAVTLLGPYDRPEVLLSSTPPLPDDDLLVLVLAGQLPGTSATKTGRAAAQSVAVYLAKDYLSRWLAGADPEDETSWVDRFDFQIGRDITRSGGESMEASFRFADDTVQSGDALYLMAESDQYDFINFGVRLVFHFQ